MNRQRDICNKFPDESEKGTAPMTVMTNEQARDGLRFFIDRYLQNPRRFRYNPDRIELSGSNVGDWCIRIAATHLLLTLGQLYSTLTAS